MHDAGHLAHHPSLDRQHRPALAFTDHRVLQQATEPAHHLLEAIAPLGPARLQLAPHGLERLTGPVGHPAALLQAEMQPLLQLRQGAQLRHQGAADGPNLGSIDLTPQPAGGRQGGGHRQQVLAWGHPPFGAKADGGTDVGGAAKTQAPFSKAIEAQQLGGFGQPPLAFAKIERRHQGAALARTGAGAGKAGQLLRQPRPLQQLEGLGPNCR